MAASPSNLIAAAPISEGVAHVPAGALLSPAQRLMYADELRFPGRGHNIQQVICRFGQAVDADRLQAAAQALLMRHAALRLTFRPGGDGTPRQHLHAHAPTDFCLADLPVEDELLEAFLEEDRVRGFDLSRPPLIRFVLFQDRRSSGVLVITAHHLILDGRSIPLLLRDLWDRYEQVGMGEQTCAGPTFLDYLALIHERPPVTSAAEASPLSSSHTGAGLAAAIGNGGGPRGVDKRAPTATVRCQLSPQATGRLAHLQNRGELTVASILEAAWAVALARHAGKDVIAWGTIRADRPPTLAGGAEIVGCMINVLPMSAELGRDETVAHLLGSVRAQHLALRDCMSQCLLDLRNAGDGARASLEALAVYDRLPLQEQVEQLVPALRGCVVELRERPAAPLVLKGFGGTTLALELLFDTSVLDRPLAACLLDHVKALLESLPAALEGSIAAWPIHSGGGGRGGAGAEGGERDRLVHDWSATEAEYPVRCIHQWFADSVKARPHATAIMAGDGAMTYAELDAAAERVAAALRQVRGRTGGIAGGATVGVYLDRSLEMISTLLGVLKAGCAYVPLDDAWPAARMAAVLERTGANCLLASRGKLARLGEVARHCPGLQTMLCVSPGHPHSTDRAGWPNTIAVHGLDIPAAAAHPPADDPDALAYVIFTSGSTGEPKGVAVRHRAVSNLIHWVNRTFDVSPADRLLFVTSLCFDLSVYDVFGILAAGGTVRIASEADVQDPGRLWSMLDREGITFWDSAPAFFKQLFALPHAAEPTPAEHSLRLVFLSGDWIPLDLPPKLWRRFARPEVVALGGATEATVWSNYFRFDAIEPHWRSIPYGCPIQNARYYVLDQQLHLCPIGVPGELHIGGACLADGYANDAQRTRERFIEDPFAATAAGRLYKTGDLARWLPDGNLELLGRMDQQVKLRGFRVELGEVEAALRSHPDVADAIANVEGDAMHEQRLVGYVVPRDGATIDLADLRRRLRQRVPQYMMPAALAVLDQVPLTRNGKLDRRRLPAIPPAADDGSGLPSSREPRSAAERTLLTIWQSVLRLPQAGVDDGFFDFGGDSLMAMKVVLDAQQAGLEVTPGMVFRHPTVAELAAALEASPARQESAAGASEASRVAKAASIPLSPSQAWFFDWPLRDPEHYSAVFALECLEAVEFRHLELALAQIVGRHDALQMRFAHRDGQWIQQCGGVNGSFAASLIDVSHREAVAQDAVLQRTALDLRQRLRLDSGPLLAAALCDLRPRPARLLLAVHHLAFDGVSLWVLLNELSALIQPLRSGDPASLPPPSCAFSQWTTRLAEWAEDPRQQASAQEWLDMPWDRVRPLQQDRQNGLNTYAASAVESLDLSNELTARLFTQGAGRAPSVKGDSGRWLEDELLLAALGLPLRDRQSSGATALDYTSHGRQPLWPGLDLTGTIGYLTCVAPAVLDLGDAVSFHDALTAARQALILPRTQAPRYAALRYGADAASPAGRLRQLPRPMIKFNYQGRMDDAPHGLFRLLPQGLAGAGAGAGPGGVLAAENQRRYLINVEAAILQGRLHVEIKYSRNHHRPETIRHWLQAAADHLAAFARETQRSPTHAKVEGGTC